MVSPNELQRDLLRQKIFRLVKEYYSIVHRTEEFVPGKSRIPYSGRVYDENEIINLVDASLEFWLTAGRYTTEFEKTLSDYIGVRYCGLTNSGSSANLLAISALTSKKLGAKRLRPGDEVITVAAGFPTTITPIIQNRLVPVFVDVEIPTYNIAFAKLEEARSNKTKAVILAHTLGNPFNLSYVKSFCQKHSLWLIEDNCDALGSKYKGQLTGSFGDIATFSFYPPHHITMGEGGALTTNDDQLKKIIESFRDWGRDCWCPSGKDNTCGKRFSWQMGELPKGYDHKYIYSHLGYNLKITDLQAAVGCAQLKKLSCFVERRKENFSSIYEGLKQYEDKFKLPKATEDADPSWFGFILTVRDDVGFTRDEIVNYLESKLIQTRMLFAGNMLKHPAFDEIRNNRKAYRIVGGLVNTDKITTNTFWIGVYPGLTQEMIDYVIEAIDSFIAAS